MVYGVWGWFDAVCPVGAWETSVGRIVTALPNQTTYGLEGRHIYIYSINSYILYTVYTKARPGWRLTPPPPGSAERKGLSKD